MDDRNFKGHAIFSRRELHAVIEIVNSKFNAWERWNCEWYRLFQSSLIQDHRSFHVWNRSTCSRGKILEIGHCFLEQSRQKRSEQKSFVSDIVLFDWQHAEKKSESVGYFWFYECFRWNHEVFVCSVLRDHVPCRTLLVPTHYGEENVLCSNEKRRCIQLACKQPFSFYKEASESFPELWAHARVVEENKFQRRCERPQVHPPHLHWQITAHVSLLHSMLKKSHWLEKGAHSHPHANQGEQTG